MSVWDFDDDDEVDEEYVAAQRAKRPKRSKPPRPSAVPRESAMATAKPSAEVSLQKGPKTFGTQDTSVAVLRCTAQSTVRYPKDYEVEELRGQAVLDADGARQLKPCELPRMKGQEVCQKHGGLAPQAQKAAKLRLLAATEPLIAALLRIGLNETLSPADRTRAIVAALDRAGFRSGMEINVAVPGWQKVLRDMFGDDEDDDSPDRTIDGELAHKQPANAYNNHGTSYREASDSPEASRARVEKLIADGVLPASALKDLVLESAAESEPDTQLGFSSQAGPAIHIGSSDDAPPAEWGLGKKRRGQVIR